jgi:hypothetical protein
MIYNYYLEGRSNDIFITHYITGYKTIRGLERARNKYCERNKVVLLGYCLYSANEEYKYKPDAYKILDRFNCKMFFEYWN